MSRFLLNSIHLHCIGEFSRTVLMVRSHQAKAFSFLFYFYLPIHFLIIWLKLCFHYRTTICFLSPLDMFRACNNSNSANLTAFNQQHWHSRKTLWFLEGNVLWTSAETLMTLNSSWTWRFESQWLHSCVLLVVEHLG